MKNSAKVALGGIITALSLVTMLLTAVIPYLQYALPAIAGALLVLMVIEINKKWAFMTYVSVSILSVLILTDKETAMMYIAYFGWYPILKPVLESRIKTTPVCFLVKIIISNAAFILGYLIVVKVFGIPIDEFQSAQKWVLPLFLAAANLMFVLYDICITKLVEAYLLRWQKKFRKLFK